MESLSTHSVEGGKAFLVTTRKKVEQLLEDFADGKLNREQFHILYERYQTQMNGVKALLSEEDPSKWIEAIDGEQTIDIRSRLMAKAKGMLIYRNSTGSLLDKLGEFLIDPLIISSQLDKLAQLTGKTPANEIPQLVVEEAGLGWLYLAQGKLTTIVMTFSREPTADQKATIKHLLEDFEQANAVALKQPIVSPDELGMPFRVIIQRAGRL